MKQLLLLPIAVAALTFAGCDTRVETPASDTTVVTPPAGEKKETNTTVVTPPAGGEKKTETNTTVVNPPAPAPAPPPQ